MARTPIDKVIQRITQLQTLNETAQQYKSGLQTIPMSSKGSVIIDSRSPRVGKGNVEVDPLGTLSQDWLIDDFMEYYKQHTQEVDSISTKTLNFRVKLHDKDGNKFKIRRKYGKMVLVRVNPVDTTTKIDIVRGLSKMLTQLEQLQSIVEVLRNGETLDVDKPTEETILKPTTLGAKMKV